jgi:hypothetical protein
MATLQLPYFGEVSTNTAEECIDITVPLYDTEVELDINFGDGIQEQHLKDVQQFLLQLDTHYKRVRHYLLANYHSDEDDTVRTYLKHHIDILTEDARQAIQEGNNTGIADTIHQLMLVRIGFYPGEDPFATLDFSLGQDETNHLVVVNVNKDGELDYMTIES